MVDKNLIIEALREVYDPEIPINIYDLGLIYEINIKGSGSVSILMSLTSPTCPVGEYIQEMVHDAVMSVEGVKSVDVELTFDPLWTPDRVSLEAKEELGLTDENEIQANNLDVGKIFSSTNFDSKSSENLNVCFNCGLDDSKIPILKCVYKGEKTKICSKCLSKF